MSDNERQQQEYEFVMEGITTRMQIALEKMADSNKMLAENNKRQSHIWLIVLFIVVLGFLANNIIMIVRAEDAVFRTQHE